MASLTQMSFILGHFNTLQVANVLVAEADKRGWHEEEGFFYHAFVQGDEKFRPQAFLSATGTARLEKEVFENLELDIVEVIGEIKPHRHHKSDVVLKSLCTGVRGMPSPASDGSIFVENNWYRLPNEQLIVLPRGAAHGFKRPLDAGRRLFLIGLNYPPIADDDVEYL